MERIEVLVAAMHQKDVSLYKEMNLKTDAIIINQCDRFDRLEIHKNGNSIKFYSFNERGVGKSRNQALMNSSGDICMIADEDMVYVDNYENIVQKAFREYPQADMILFNIGSLNPNVKFSNHKYNKKLNRFNCLRFGACRVAFKREKILRSNVRFSLLFGGGAKYGSGEDTLFISDCLKKGLKVYTYKAKIADIKQENSTWFTGNNNKYFKDKGALCAAITPKYAKLLALMFAVKWYPRYRKRYSILTTIKMMFDGVNEYRMTTKN